MLPVRDITHGRLPAKLLLLDTAVLGVAMVDILVRRNPGNVRTKGGRRLPLELWLEILHLVLADARLDEDAAAAAELDVCMAMWITRGGCGQLPIERIASYDDVERRGTTHASAMGYNPMRRFLPFRASAVERRRGSTDPADPGVLVLLPVKVNMPCLYRYSIVYRMAHFTSVILDSGAMDPTVPRTVVRLPIALLAARFPVLFGRLTVHDGIARGMFTGCDYCYTLDTWIRHLCRWAQRTRQALRSPDDPASGTEDETDSDNQSDIHMEEDEHSSTDEF